ncbi:hemolysin, partial [Vibrio anguillarum]|nr:hemolysin [Vibrio anguillarum]MBF4391169.1 hemolysin [Vibrio anguillarum]
KHQRIEIAIGDAINHKEIQHLCDETLVSYLRLNTYLLSHITPTKRNKTNDEPLQPIAQRLPLSALLHDIEQLSFSD